MASYVSVILRRSIRELFNDRCAYCQTAESLTIDIFEIEHIKPRAIGGKTIIGNRCLSCPTCNRYKAYRTGIVPESSHSDAENKLFNPQLDNWYDHFRWNEDGTELIGMTSTGRATIDLLRINRPQMIRVRRRWVAMGEHPPTND